MVSMGSRGAEYWVLEYSMFKSFALYLKSEGIFLSSTSILDNK